MYRDVKHLSPQYTGTSVYVILDAIPCHSYGSKKRGTRSNNFFEARRQAVKSLSRIFIIF